MARTDTLEHYLTDIADAIRTKTGASGTISASSFDTQITNIPSGTTYKIKSGSSSDPGYAYVINQLDTVELEGTSCQYMFYKCTGTSLPKVTNVTSSVTNMAYMYYGCQNVTSIDVSGYNTSGVETMNSMFYSSNTNPALKRLDLSNFTTTSLTNCANMFYQQRNLAVLDISNFDFTNVTNYGNMFNTVGNYASTSDGAYAYGLPYIYVKDATAQNWVLTQSNGHPSGWSTDNVVIKPSQT